MRQLDKDLPRIDVYNPAFLKRMRCKQVKADAKIAEDASISEIIRAIADQHDVSVHDILTGRRTLEVCKARGAAILAIKAARPGYSQKKIAITLGIRGQGIVGRYLKRRAA